MSAPQFKPHVVELREFVAELTERHRLHDVDVAAALRGELAICTPPEPCTYPRCECPPPEGPR